MLVNLKDLDVFLEHLVQCNSFLTTVPMKCHEDLGAGIGQLVAYFCFHLYLLCLKKEKEEKKKKRKNHTMMFFHCLNKVVHSSFTKKGAISIF